jgi:hypothetical protein
MHRVSPKGEGKVSKRNQVKKKSNNDGMEVEEKGKREDQYKEKQMVQSTSPSSLSLGVLSFKPRGMRQKPKISLDSSSTKK